MNKVDKVYKEAQLASIWHQKFKESMVHKAPYVRKWNTYFEAYNGDYFKNASLPEYKSDFVANYIFSIVETIRPIMLDNDPKFQVMPRQPEGMQFSNDLQEAMLYEWDRESMNLKLYRELINTLVTGNSIFYISWDSEDKNVKAIPVSPYKFFTDPLATSLEDAEYVIYADYFNAEVIRRKFPEKAEKLVGSSVNHSEIVNDNDRNGRVDNQILILEVYTRDYENEDREVGNLKISKSLYPNGRMLIIAPELGLILEDKENPYKESVFPFVIMKDYDIPGKFWGEGEVSQLLSPQKHMNELNNAVVDNAKATANMPWIVDKNSGIATGQITSRPGLIIRKNPGSEVRRDQAPSMPHYVINAIDTYKQDMSEISGIFNSVKGNSETGVYTAQGILALQEAGQSRIRLKVKLMEECLGKLATRFYHRMKQYWKEDRWIGITKHDGSYDLKKFTSSSLKFDYDIKITAGSTMPVNRSAMLDLMIRLAQTQMPDGQPLVDREAVVHYLPEEVKGAILDRMKGHNVSMQQMQQQMEELGQVVQQSMQEMQGQLQQTAEQLMAQLEEVKATSDENDEQTFSIIEELTSAIEHINKQILQLQKKHDIIEKDKKELEKENNIRRESYNQGYSDAERSLQESVMPSSDLIYSEEDDEIGLDGMSGLEDMQGIAEIPEDVLAGLENMSDEELNLFMSQNPELAELIQGGIR